MIVYGDLLFLINFSMDFLCFYIACRLLHCKLPTARAAFASLCGGIYSVFALFLKASQPSALALDISVLFLMCLCVFWGRGARRIFGAAALYLFTSSLLGGIMTASFSLFNRIKLFAEDLGFADGVDVWIFALLALVSSALTLRGGAFFKSSAQGETVLLRIESEIGKVELSALVDSGNLACEPISGRGVVFASLPRCKALIDEESYSAIECGGYAEDMPIKEKMRLVPSRTVNGARLLPAFRFKKISAKTKGGIKELDVYVALVNEESLGGCGAIISRSALD